ncbi:hypothetical protein COO60DRAFT_1699888 [Scenedesmus sp. NREL 46B-D3]|nr:hypothetical protein COO60DRAFT_1699888 [Scenedesmus sp. NREL 46B-D3]
MAAAADCAPGLARAEDGTCQPCEQGKYCTGGDATYNFNNAASDCPQGLQTLFAGAKSQAQCFTQPGYGRVSSRALDGKTILSAVLCDIGTYNLGGNSAGCQRCGPGLVTAGNGSASASACVAPAGSYLDKGIGKLCPRGTYSTGLNTSPFCIPCAAGITTEHEGSSSAADCILAARGYHIDPVNATLAMPCPRDTYQDQEAAVNACTPCPFGWRTKDVGATGTAMCLAPPGWELVDGAEFITECQNGWYKADWNRNPCLPCGAGLITPSNGTVSMYACLVPAGYGIVSYSPLVAQPCEKNMYGDSVARAAVANARCVSCPMYMYTADTLEGIARSDLPGSPLFTSELDCKVLPGWGTTNTIPHRCPTGTYNEGKNRLNCKFCSSGYTTTEEGKTNASACVIQAGWRLAAGGLPAPCDVGTFSLGGDATDPAPTQCTACPSGFSTQEDESVKPDDCDVCAAGYGGPGCAVCGYGSFASGGQAAGDPCASCAAGTTSARGATHSQQCLPQLVDARADVFALSDESAWSNDSASSGVACGAACTASDSCVMYRFTTDGTTDQCQLFNEDVTNGDQKLGFKVDLSEDFVIYTILGTQSVGNTYLTLNGKTLAECLQACSADSQCELFMLSGAGECRLARSEFEQSFTSMFSADEDSGDNDFSDDDDEGDEGRQQQQVAEDR